MDELGSKYKLLKGVTVLPESVTPRMKLVNIRSVDIMMCQDIIDVMILITWCSIGSLTSLGKFLVSLYQYCKELSMKHETVSMSYYITLHHIAYSRH